MTFNTFLFYPFFIAVVIIYYLFPKRLRWIWLLIASYTFYAFSDIRFALILLAFTGISYFSGIVVEIAKNLRVKKLWMVLGLLIHVGVLIIFKYLNFFSGVVSAATSVVGFQWSFRGVELIYPVGISFYTFQAISYLLDVYSEKTSAEKNFLQYALFISFFPKLLIGPIERYNHLKPQLIDPAPFKYQSFVDSLVRIGWGLFKKVVIADRLAVVANTVFAAPGEFESPKLVLAVFAFSFQIYIDFSAYCDIAIGTAKILGINISENFKQPYFATSVIDFWRRWHITLSNWLRDYIFMNLNFKHFRRKPRELWTALDVMLTFLVSGLWHGANWTFIVWGALHGIYQMVEILTKKMRDEIVKKLKINRSTFFHKTFQVLLTFGLISFAWIFFKADSIDQALSIIRSIATFDQISSNQAWRFFGGRLGLDKKDFAMMVLTLGILLAVEFTQRKHDLLGVLNKTPAWLRWVVYYALFFSITIFGFYGASSVVDFVYIQF